MANSNQKFFVVLSPGFLYSVIVSALTIFAGAGVAFPKVPIDLGAEIVNSFNTGGVYALIGVIVASVVFPIYNAISAGTFSLKGIFSRNLTWIALGNIAVSGLALTGFVLPDGTPEQIVGAVSAKDWMSVVSIVALTVGNTLLRLIKQKAQI
mgnify:FL=1